MRFRLFFNIIWVLCVGLAVFASPNVVGKQSKPDLLSEKECLIEDEAHISFGSIKKLIQRCSIESLNDLLAVLPQDFRARFTLVYQSKSTQRQSANMKKPRVIMFGQTGRTVVTFTGDSKHNDYNRLELMEFNLKTNKFEFHEIQFPSEKEKDIHTKNLGLSENDPYQTWPDHSKLVRFNQNETSCMKCHGSDPAPIWENYHLWPGVYGSGHDSFYSEYPSLDPNEPKAFEEFTKTYKKDARYQYLAPLKGSKYSPYADYSDDTNDSDKGHFKFRPNLFLTQLLSLYQAKALLAKIKKSPIYEIMKPLFLFQISECDKKDYYSNTSAIDKNRKGLKEIIIKALADFPQIQTSYQEIVSSNDYPAQFLRTEIPWELVALLKVMGIKNEDFSLAFERNKAVINHITPGMPLMTEILMDVTKTDPDLGLVVKTKKEDYFESLPSNNLPAGALDWSPIAKSCKQIKSKLKSTMIKLAKFKNEEELKACSAKAGNPMKVTDEKLAKVVNKLLPENQAPSPLMIQCAGCHSHSELPQIPLDDMNRVSQEMKSKMIERLGAKGTKKMPPDLMLSDEEKKQLINYINSL